MSDNIKVLIIGSGFMTDHYLKVISSMKIESVVIGRGVSNVNKLKIKYPDTKFYPGGLKKYIKSSSLEKFTHIFNLVNIENTIQVTETLLKYGAKKILLEKPGSLYANELISIKNQAKNKGVEILIGYNRRFYESIIKLKELITLDKGVQNIHFEFTEWVHTIKQDDYSNDVLEKWIISNSSHVLDTVFFLIGLPKEINAKSFGINKIKWHKSGSIFIGSGISVKGVPFTYNTNWNSAGRWSIEVTTNNNRYFLRPMEKLFKQKKGDIEITEVNLANEKDIKYKPGIFNVVESFINNDYNNLVGLKDQIELIQVYNKIGNY